MKWVLVLMFMGPAGTTTETIEFGSRDLCEGAARHLVELHNSTDERERSAVAKGTCVQRFRETPDGS